MEVMETCRKNDGKKRLPVGEILEECVKKNKLGTLGAEVGQVVNDKPKNGET